MEKSYSELPKLGIAHTTAYLRPAEDVGNHDQEKGLNENPQRTSIPSVINGAKRTSEQVRLQPTTKSEGHANEVQLAHFVYQSLFICFVITSLSLGLPFVTT